jgi:hypothetical protein
MALIVQLHEDLGHFGEQRTLAKIYKRYFWHNRIGDVKTIVKMCQLCQMVRKVGNIRFKDEKLKSIPICELFCRVAMDTTGPLPKTKSRNKYIMVAIDHYSKWCEAKAVTNHGVKTTTKFLKDDVICRYKVPKFVLINNGKEWATKFYIMCKDYGIHDQHTAPQWPQCNRMAERLIKIIKHGITVLSATPKNVNYWDEQLAKVMFRYRCGLHANTKFSPFMIMIGRTPCLKVDNYLQSLTVVIDDTIDVETIAKQYFLKMKLIVSIHESVPLNVEQAQKKQKIPMLPEKGNKPLKD